MLRVELRAALNRVAQTGKPTEVLNLAVDLEGQALLIDLSVAPADEIAPQCLLVVFNERLAPNTAGDGEAPMQPSSGAGSRENELYDEVVRLKMQLRDVVEQHQASTEELQASNEELQAMNEDLRCGRRGARGAPSGGAIDQRGAGHRQRGAAAHRRGGQRHESRPAQPDGVDVDRDGVPRP